MNMQSIHNELKGARWLAETNTRYIRKSIIYILQWYPDFTTVESNIIKANVMNVLVIAAGLRSVENLSPFTHRVLTKTSVIKWTVLECVVRQHKIKEAHVELNMYNIP